MTFREHIYNICNATDFDDKDSVITTIQYLASKLVNYNDLLLTYEQKLKTLMTAADFEDYASEQAKIFFKREVLNMEDGEVKDFILDNFDEIIEIEI